MPEGEASYDYCTVPMQIFAHFAMGNYAYIMRTERLDDLQQAIDQIEETL